MSDRQSGSQGVIACIGDDLPLALVRAAGLTPLRLAADRAMATPFSAARGLDTQLNWRARAYLEIIAERSGDFRGILLSHVDAVVPQLFAALRELPELGAITDHIFFCDLLRLNRPASLHYNERRLQQLWTWLEARGRPITDAALDGEIGAENERIALAGQGTPSEEGHRIVLTGSAGADPWIVDALESAGGIVITERDAQGMRRDVQPIDRSLPALQALARHAAAWSGGSFGGVARYRRSLETLVAANAADGVVHVTLPGDEAAAWSAQPAAILCAVRALPFLAISIKVGLEMDVAAQLADFAETLCTVPPAADVPEKPRPTKSAVKPVRDQGRSRKSLSSVADFSAYQKQWFAGVRARAAAGEPFALVNANAPQEILRALDIPFVVNQWWASIVAAKQQSRRYAGLLRAEGYPTNVEAYSAQGLAALFDDDADQAPWGGLPRPTMLHAVPDSDATRNLFDLWAEAVSAPLHLYERSIESRWSLPEAWWDLLPDDWEATLEPERLDLMVEDFRTAISAMEQQTGRVFDATRFAEIMNLVNEQEDYYRRTRDLIAKTKPVPVSIVDTMPATMVPQWHRGTEWARDAARAFYEEVAARVDAGQGACADERLRLMWVGRGLWSDMGFYQRWEESHGAVFVWSMYLGLAADGYIRNFDGGRDSLRALAARFVTMGDELRMPTWAGAWHVKEARIHSVNAAIAIDDADPFVLQALEKAGVPVLRLKMSNYGGDGGPAIDQEISSFLTRLAH